MNLIITSCARLRELYGQQDARAVLVSIDRLVAARAMRDVPSRVLLIEQGDQALGVVAADVEPEAIVGQLAAVAAALKRDGDALSSVLIVGGPEIVPFYEVPNPTPGDGDETVPGDWIYSGADELAPPAWPVGRIPGAGGDGARLLLRLLELAAAARPARETRKAFGYGTAAWREAAAAVYTTIDAPERMLVSPPTLASTLDRRRLDGARLVYANLHGVRDGPPWYGQAADHPALVSALRPSDLLGLDLRGAVVVSEACYGAAIAGRDESTSLALAFLARGALGFFGATAVSYGPPTPPAGEADLMALHFLRAVTQPGVSIGAAFAAARAGMLQDTLARQQRLDEDDQKTLLEFVLYGDPTAVVSSR